MRGRRWAFTAVAVIAALLIIGRAVAGWYVDYLWFASLGAAAVWKARAVDLLLLRGSAFAGSALFVFINLFAVRHSVVSLVLPRRVGNIEIGEEVPGRYLTGAVIVLALIIGLLLALPHDDWQSVELVRHGEAFRESDPYFQFDLAFWVYWLPLETSLHLWSLIALLVTTLVVVFFYALTPSLRWEGGRLRVSGYVRRHFVTLGAVLLLLLAWSYRLDAYRLLLEGSGALGAFNAIDHKVGLPASLVLSLSTVVAAMLLLWAGWMGQLRLAFGTITTALILALTLKQFVPPIAGRMLTPADPDLRNVPYVNTRAAYTRRAFDVDRIDRTDSLPSLGTPRDSTLATVKGLKTLPNASPSPTMVRALRGVALWDALALERAVRNERGANTSISPGWESIDGRLRALLVAPPLEGDGNAGAGVWNVKRVDADLADEQGRVIASSIEGREELALPPVIVHDSASDYALVSDSTGRVAAPALTEWIDRVALAWGLQNPSLLGSDVPRDRGRVVLHRNVRDRVRRLLPFFAQGRRVTPLVYRDSLYWTVHLYSASEFYPLSDPVGVAGREFRYFKHAGVALVNAHSGRVFTIADISPDPVAASWIRRFPSLFVASGALDHDLADRLPPPLEGALVHARIFAAVGPRGESAPTSHLPRHHGGDTLFANPAFAPYADSLSGRIALVYPVLDASERVRGVVVAPGGADYEPRWISFGATTQRWTAIVDRLRRSIDSATALSNSRETIVRGPVRVVPTGRGGAYVQTAYTWHPDGVPSVRLVAVLLGDSVRTGASVPVAAGLPAPAIPEAPLSPAAFRSRVEQLYGEMREAMRRGDWPAFGAAYEAIGRLLRATPAKP